MPICTNAPWQVNVTVKRHNGKALGMTTFAVHLMSQRGSASSVLVAPRSKANGQAALCFPPAQFALEHGPSKAGRLSRGLSPLNLPEVDANFIARDTSLSSDRLRREVLGQVLLLA